MRKAALTLCFLPTFALAGTPAELPPAAVIEVANKDQAALMTDAERCMKATLKHKQFQLTNGSATSLLGGRPTPTAPSSTPDPSVIIDLQAAAGSIDGRHIFAITGFAAEGVIQADLRVETKPGKYRMTWHDAMYAPVVDFGWERNLIPLIMQALPHKKAIAEISAATDRFNSCMSTPPAADNW